MILIIGLGNPGKQFQGTRHNVGFSVLDRFRKENSFSPWKERKRLMAKISEGRINGEKVLLAKPQTFMNASGKAVKLLIENCKLTLRATRLEIENLFVVHDDLDLLLGKMKISKGRGSAGHKGVQSIIDELKTRDFLRFRVGIKPETEVNSKQSIVNSKFDNFVLEKFTKKEQKIIKEMKKRACQALKLAIKEGIEKAMTAYNY